MILKAPNAATGEKGVIMVKYNSTFAELAALFHVTELLNSYFVVLEPDYSRNFQESFFLLCGSDASIVLTSRCAEDHEFIHRAELGFESVSLGASDWVDPDIYVPAKHSERDYDIVMVAAWARVKRHDLLFRSLAALRPRRFRVALIGYSWELSRHDIEQQIQQLDLAHSCDVYDSIPFTEVAQILARSKVAVHLSKQEGTNKATFEALCCDTPLIVYRHNLGFPMEAINSRTGILADDHELPSAIVWMVDNWDRFKPRRWVLANTGFNNATQRLNEKLRQMATELETPWTHDVAPRVNRVNPRYRFDADRERLDPAYRDLARSLRC